MTVEISPEKFERLMVDMGTSRYRRMVDQLREQGRQSRIPSRAALVPDAALRVQTALEDWLYAPATRGSNHRLRPTLQRLPAEISAAITVHAFLDQITEEQPFARTAAIVGDRWRLELLYARARQDFKDSIRGVDKQFKRSAEKYTRLKGVMDPQSVAEATIDNTEARLIGHFLSELFCAVGGLVDISRSHPKSARYVVPRQETLEWLAEADSRLELAKPFLLPTKTPPIPWASFEGGGYTTDMVINKVVIPRCPRRILVRISPEETPEWFRAINILQAVPWQIDQDMRELALEAYQSRTCISPLPDPEDRPVGDRPEAEKEGVAYKAWVQSIAENREARAQRYRIDRTFHIARILGDSPLYFPHRGDFRGRLYPQPQVLHPQGDKLSKGLLRFAEPSPLDTDEAWRWYRIHGANTFGVDKVSFDDRVAWTEENHSRILNVAKDPLGDKWWWDADSPWCFLAWAREFAENVGLNAPTSHIPVAVDGSNNGLQLLSLLARDPAGAHATNVSPSGTPQDIYRVVAEKLTVLARKAADGFEDPKVRTSLRRLMDHLPSGFDRKWVKRPVMTTPYGVTRRSMTEYLWDHYTSVWPSRVDPNQPFTSRGPAWTALMALSGLLVEAIEEVMPEAMSVMRWLQDCATLIAKSGEMVRWVSPIGFYVEQAYKQRGTKVVRLSFGRGLPIQKKHTTVPITTGKGVSVERQKLGVAPNYVHSLDAAILSLTISSLHRDWGIEQFAAVHDSFGVPATFVPLLQTAIREAAFNVFKDDPLGNLSEQWGAYGLDLPPPPERGDLDPMCVIDSPYFFS